MVLDINECDLSPSPCSRYASCENMEGTYNCTCNDGYRGDGHHCADIDECAEGERRKTQISLIYEKQPFLLE